MKKKILLLLSCLISTSLFAKDDLSWNGAILGQGAEENGNQQWPINGYMGAGWKPAESSWNAKTNFHVYKKLNSSKKDFNLYQTNIDGTFLQDKLHLTAGRQFLSLGLNAWLLDGMRLEIQPKETWSVATYAGTPRTPDNGDFNTDDGMISGLGFFLHSVGGFTGQIGTHYRKKDIQGKDWNENDQLFGAAYGRYQFSEETAPSLYSGVEYDASGGSLDQAVFGLDWHPNKIWNIQNEYGFYNDNREETRDTILSRFAGGRVLQGEVNMTQQALSRLRFFETYAYFRLKDPALRTQHHHILRGGFTWEILDGTEATPSYQWVKSYGGKLHLAMLDLFQEIRPWWTVSLRGDYAKFSKITSDNGAAVSVVIWNDFNVWKDFYASTNVEFHKNNDIEREFRGGLAIRWSLGTPPVIPAMGKGILQ